MFYNSLKLVIEEYCSESRTNSYFFVNLCCSSTFSYLCCKLSLTSVSRESVTNKLKFLQKKKEKSIPSFPMSLYVI